MSAARPAGERVRPVYAGLTPCAGDANRYHRPETHAACEACVASERETPREAGSAQPRVSTVDLGVSTRARQRPGEKAEAALYAALQANGFDDFVYLPFTSGCGAEHDPRKLFLRQLTWGAYLDPPRRFSADVGFPFSRLLVEVEGQVHSIKGKRHGDVLRRQLAEANGWRVLSLLPSQVHDGSAVALVRRALGGGA